MDSEQLQKIRAPCDIDTLPEKLKLPSSYVKKIIREKKLQKEDKEKEDEVVVRCQDENNDNFQLHLRAGMTDVVDKCLEERGMEILNSGFTISLTLRAVGDNVKKGESAPLLGHMSGSCTGNSSINDAEEGAVTEGPINHSKMKSKSNKHNANIHVNALLLAILAQQRKSVECILKYIFRGEIEEGQSTCDELEKVLGKRVEIENVANVTKHDSFLNNMNLFHLSCYYYPEAIQILQELCCSTDGALGTRVGNLLRHLKDIEMKRQQNGDGFKCTPLHIAAGKSNVKSARYVIA
jgi:hypothetical protein